MAVCFSFSAAAAYAAATFATFRYLSSFVVVPALLQRNGLGANDEQKL